MTGFDAWLTREPDWGPEYRPLAHCARCGGFLRTEADRTEPWEDGEQCDGTVTEFLAEWGTESVSTCGTDTKPHEPHWVVHQAGVTLYYTCRRCGYENKEVEL